MKIAYLTNQYPAISHTFILREVRGLRRLGVEVATASVNRSDREERHLTAEERKELHSTYYLKSTPFWRVAVSVIRQFVKQPMRSFSSLVFAVRLGGTDLKVGLFGIFYFVEAVLIARWLASEEATHLHVHFATPASTAAMIASRLSGIPFSMTVHGPDEFYEVQKYRLEEKIRRAQFIVCISSFCRSQLMKLSSFEYWNKFEVCRLGVDVAHFCPKPSPSSKGMAGDFEFLCVGRLTPAKGQHILVDAIDLLVRNGRRVRLCLVGDGPDRNSLKSLVRRRRLENCVVFEGAVNQDRISALYARADAFVLPSFAEGIPVVLMEAMAMGKPCVSTTITGIPELIDNGVDGLLVRASDTNELAKAMDRLISDEPFRERLCVRGRQKIQQRYDLSENLVRLAEIFRERLGQRQECNVQTKSQDAQVRNAA